MKTRIIDQIRNSKFSKLLSFLLIAIIVLQTNGCFYYRAVIPTEAPPIIVKNENVGSYIMMHVGDEVKVLDNITILDDGITCRMSEVVGHQYYKNIEPGKVRRYKMNKHEDQSEVLNEVHIYVSKYTVIENDQISIMNDDMENTILFDPATGATVLSFGSLSYLGVNALFIVILMIASCPFVYTYDGDQYIFSGEIYSGAIYPAVERHDYLSVNSLRADDGKYRLRLANEIREIQNTNLAELLYVDHPKDIKIMIDKYGQMHSVSSPILANSATNLKGNNLKGLISEKDDKKYVGEDLRKDPDLLDGVILEYNLPENTDKVKLIVSARNSFWLEYVYKKFHDLFGHRYDKYVNKKSKQSGDELLNEMLDQHLPLSIYIEKDGNWEFMDYFNIAGPMAMKDDIISIDVSDISNKPLRLKLEYGTQFWEIDYVAVDASPDLDLKLSKLKIESAIDEKGGNVAPLLTQDDNLYYTQPEIGNTADLVFEVPELLGENRSIFLHSKGYYKILRESKGKANISRLRNLKKGDGLTQYSVELMVMMNEPAIEQKVP